MMTRSATHWARSSEAQADIGTRATFRGCRGTVRGRHQKCAFVVASHRSRRQSRSRHRCGGPSPQPRTTWPATRSPVSDACSPRQWAPSADGATRNVDPDHRPAPSTSGRTSTMYTPIRLRKKTAERGGGASGRRRRWKGSGTDSHPSAIATWREQTPAKPGLHRRECRRAGVRRLRGEGLEVALVVLEADAGPHRVLSGCTPRSCTSTGARSELVRSRVCEEGPAKRASRCAQEVALFGRE
jgi:hypothetical protein